jgi:hypothetical protein
MQFKDMTVCASHGPLGQSNRGARKRKGATFKFGEYLYDCAFVRKGEVRAAA